MSFKEPDLMMCAICRTERPAEHFEKVYVRTDVDVVEWFPACVVGPRHCYDDYMAGREARA